MNAPLDRILADLAAALGRLEEALLAPRTALNRDASIQRFEFTFELFWKALKVFAEEQGLRVFSPRESLRAGYRLGLLPDEQSVLRMLEDRNKTSHLYNEAMAEDVYQRLAVYAELMSKATGRLPGAGGG